MTLDRKAVEEMCEDLFTRLVGPCERTLIDANLTPKQISKILLVGGMTRMPAVREKVRQIFGKEGDASLNPDEVVAIGAIVQAGILTG